MVETPEISAIVQQLAFVAGFSWAMEGSSISYTEKKVLWFGEDESITYSELVYAKGKDGKINTVEELIEFFLTG